MPASYQPIERITPDEAAAGIEKPFSGNPFTDGLASPIQKAAGTVGSGQFEEGMDPSQMMQGSVQAMGQVMEQGMQAGSSLLSTFAGAAASALGQFAGMAGQALTGLMGRSGSMGANIGKSGESVGRSTALITYHLQELQHVSEALTPLLVVPGVAGALVAEAQNTMNKVTAQIADLEGELSGNAGDLAATTAPDAGSPSTPSSGSVQPAMSAMQSGMSAGTQALSGIGSGMTQAMSSVTGGIGQLPQAFSSMLGGMSGAGHASAVAGGLGGLGVGGMAGLANPFTGAGHAVSTAGGVGGGGMGGTGAGAARMLLDPRTMGRGAQLFLPDGSTSQAPNAAAANAVRHALSQVGVPYEWGGNKPGVGLDCSGLTQWAYHESGVDLPRLAQEQGVGIRVDQHSVMPGDLAVWDGHVAMVIGNGMMVEAGDPVQISPIRTTNAGQGFHGFFRPTGN